MINIGNEKLEKILVVFSPTIAVLVDCITEGVFGEKG